MTNKLTLHVVDMSEDDCDHAQKVILEAFEHEREERKIAHKIKTQFDKDRGKSAASIVPAKSNWFI